jgi:hypothetical protein
MAIAGFPTETLDGDRLVLRGLADLARSVGFLPEATS